MFDLHKGGKYSCMGRAFSSTTCVDVNLMAIQKPVSFETWQDALKPH